MNIISAGVIATCIGLLSSCASLYTTVIPGNQPIPYAGTKLDVNLIRSTIVPKNGCLPVQCSNDKWLTYTFATADIGLSVVADTVLLPYTLSVSP